VSFSGNALKPIDDAICDKIGESLRHTGQINENMEKVVAQMKEKFQTSRKNNFGTSGEARGAAGMRGTNTAHKKNNSTYADRATPIANPRAGRCSDIDFAALEQARGIEG
jgi:hypothetical protein